MPKCVHCGSWILKQTHSYTCAISGDEVKWYRCLACGEETETINGATTPLEDLLEAEYNQRLYSAEHFKPRAPENLISP